MTETMGFVILGTGMVADYHRQAIDANAKLGAQLVTVGHDNPARFDEISAKYSRISSTPCARTVPQWSTAPKDGAV